MNGKSVSMNLEEAFCGRKLRESRTRNFFWHTRWLSIIRLPRAAEGSAQARAELPDYGSFVNATVWTPVFDFDSANDTGMLAITVRLPEAYFLTTSVPQTDTVQNGTANRPRAYQRTRVHPVSDLRPRLASHRHEDRQRTIRHVSYAGFPLVSSGHGTSKYARWTTC